MDCPKALYLGIQRWYCTKQLTPFFSLNLDDASVPMETILADFGAFME